ncbi:L-threonylcarbamoyladenylate synthase [Candidatus Pandoraea novymonadis]|uniref:Threonylcarbamoyl-AMP synthase n=1 Tax=Candidatus Pandoraea novymonadis TaxID=1808959 RepID=A0ABX5FEB1_9BURK|nr:L-threonylcarbamoyladenylate synthase [Candidatus Pandoraea novymonadis]PSB91798.1 Threonylcarbamoyl-AMP synthase [Candidatus Pandoraea novymonadis]
MLTKVDIEYAATRLVAGELVAFSTETVYGLGGDAECPSAVAAIYAAKGRPTDHPVIVHLSPEGDPAYWTDYLLPSARRLIDAFWPGPLTLIVKRAPHISMAISGGQDSVGLRCPSHPVAQALLRDFVRLKGGQAGVAAPSANRFGRVSPTSAQHVRDEFHGMTGVTIHVLDGGACSIGIESTIIDLSRGFPALLRPGHVTLEEVANVLGEIPQLPGQEIGNVPRASGMLKAHYSPRTPLFLLNAEEILSVLSVHPANAPMAVVAFPATLSKVSVLPADIFSVALPHTPTMLANQLYALLRRLDHMDMSCILFEALPDISDWAAINDRLRRAAATFLNIEPLHLIAKDNIIR